ncbi:MAG: hypothetical protein SPK91_00920, partial [Bacteroidales bacterium]|nr:hypothetical protein [Bacteroidales bacterium]
TVKPNLPILQIRSPNCICLSEFRLRYYKNGELGYMTTSFSCKDYERNYMTMSSVPAFAYKV